MQGNTAKLINAKAMKTNKLRIETELRERYNNVSTPARIVIDCEKVKHSRWTSSFQFNSYDVAIGVFTYDNFTTQDEQDAAEFTRFFSYGGFTYTF